MVQKLVACVPKSESLLIHLCDVFIGSWVLHGLLLESLGGLSDHLHTASAAKRLTEFGCFTLKGIRNISQCAADDILSTFTEWFLRRTPAIAEAPSIVRATADAPVAEAPAGAVAAVAAAWVRTGAEAPASKVNRTTVIFYVKTYVYYIYFFYYVSCSDDKSFLN